MELYGIYGVHLESMGECKVHFDVISQSLFLLHAYLILAFGDIPAITLIMRMKGQNGISPC